MKILMNVKAKIVGLATIGLVFGVSSAAFAAITGVCDGCHTMHNSQDGAAVVAAGPQEQLLAFDGCGGCHADGVANTGLGIPKVDDSGVGMLAGGYFDTTNTATNWPKEHNVLDLNISPDTAFANPLLPPGTTTALTEQLRCSGTNGCHQAGGHHTNVGNTLDGSTATAAGASYRFLARQSGDFISGIEDANWEFDKSATDHNQYYGQHVPKGTAATDLNTISALCGGCHSNFHGTTATDVASSGSWIRHPTDFDLSAGATEHSAYITYDPVVPVASDDLTLQTTLQENAVNDAIVTCVSCHRAHGSVQDDLLRWNYADMDAGTTTISIVGTGCFKCHSAKDG